MSQMFNWLTMDGYFIYVWPAYGLAAVVLLINVVYMKWKKKKTHRQLQQWFK